MAASRRKYHPGHAVPLAKGRTCACGRPACGWSMGWICERCARIESEMADRGGPTHHNPMAKYFTVYQILALGS